MLNFSEILRGLTDTIILAQLAQSDSYGYQINKSINEISDNAFELKDLFERDYSGIPGTVFASGNYMTYDEVVSTLS